MSYPRNRKPGTALVAATAVAIAVLAAPAALAQTGTLQDFSSAVGTVIYSAREFITMDPSKPRAEAIAVRDGKFVAVGTRAEVGAAAAALQRDVLAQLTQVPGHYHGD